MNKVLVNVYVPILNTSYDMFIPPHSMLHEVLELIKKAVAEMSDGRFIPNQDTVLCDRITGGALDINKTIYELDVRNGTKLMLV